MHGFRRPHRPAGGGRVGDGRRRSSVIPKLKAKSNQRPRGAVKQVAALRRLRLITSFAMSARTIFLSGFVAVLSLAGSTPARAAEDATPLPSVDRLAEAVRAVQVVGAPLAETARTYRVGHLELQASGGDVYAVRAAGRAVGLFLHGGGRFTYHSENRLEREVFPLNVRRATRLQAKDGALSGDFARALVLDPGVAERLEGFTLASEPAPEPVRSALSAHLGRFEKDRVAADHLVAQALLEGATDAVAVARLEAGGGDLLYVHDGLREHAESLAVMERFPSGTPVSGQRWAQGLSHQPLGEPLGHRPRRYVLKHVDVELVNPAERAMTLDVREVFEAQAPLRSLELDLWSERFTDNGAFPYQLQSVTTADGQRLAHSHRLGDLVVQLAEPLAAGQEIELRFRISGDVLDRPGGHSFWWLPIANWFPHPPRMDMAAFSYHAVVKAAKPFVPFSMGHEVRRWEDGDLRCVETRLDQPVQFAVILAGKYHTLVEERDGFRITLASYAFSHDESMRRIAHNMFQIKELYEVLLGPFPFDELHVIEINEYGFGVAPPGVIYLTREAFDPSPAGRAYREELNLRMAHEMAHMYWGHVAQMASFDEQWLSESTAEYYGAVAVGQFLGERKFREARRSWLEQQQLISEAPSVYLANRLAGEKAGRERYGLLYARGPLVLHELREELGDQTFFTLMKSFLTNFRFRPVTTKDFLALTEFITKKDYRPWLEERIFGLEK